MSYSERNRYGWNFYVRVSELKEATTKKIMFHKERKAHWQQELDKALKEIKERGIIVSEDVLDVIVQSGMSYSGGGNASNQVRLDPDLSKKLGQAYSKVEEHKQKVVDYELYSTAFNYCGQDSLALTVDDIEFFRL